MGAVEQFAKRRRKKANLQEALLASVKAGGVIAVALLAPNAVQLLKLSNDRRALYRARSAYARLVEKGLITHVIRNGKKYARLTPAGERAMSLREEQTFFGTRPRKWDKQWRVLMFDIPERRRATRNALRQFMRRNGFFLLQDSVWVYPHDCEEIIALLKADLRLGGSVLYVVASVIENDRRLRQHFGLPLS